MKMRQKLNSVLMGAAVVLLALNAVLLYQSRAPLLPAHGQDSEILMAASNTQNEAFCFIYNKQIRKLVCYMARTSGGLDLKGIRNCEYDFPDQISEYPRNPRETAVSKMRDLAKKLAEQEKDKK
ncbi:MAG: hypothetical protein JXA90_08665 [Planctomycetes bacterium]|nr:hypothetical protein [Planctomycetota bacterium]